jgi:hypothetical protein
MQKKENKKKVKFYFFQYFFFLRLFRKILESNKIRDAGGYNFSPSIAAGQPTNFNFTGNGSIINILQNQK